jgi:hypothetical protein
MKKDSVIKRAGETLLNIPVSAILFRQTHEGEICTENACIHSIHSTKRGRLPAAGMELKIRPLIKRIQ